MPMAASIAKWGATVSASWSTSQRADDPALRHAVHLLLTVGHPLWVNRYRSFAAEPDVKSAMPRWRPIFALRQNFAMCR
jgi:hypothetical protein